MENKLSIDDVASGEGRESKPITWTPTVTFMSRELVFRRDLTDEEIACLKVKRGILLETQSVPNKNIPS